MSPVESSPLCSTPSDGLADASAPAEQVVRLIYWTSAAGRQLRRCLATLASSVGLTDGELLAVWLCLGEQDGMVQGELASAVGVSPAQMSGIVERLRQRGLIEMHRQTLDRRQVWRGTATARQMLESLNGPLAAFAAGITERIAAADQSTAQSLCQRLANAVESLPVSGMQLRDNSTTRTELRSSNEAA